MQGKITKGIGGFYYVHVPKKGIYECKAKGIFRKDGIKPLVGDAVIIQILDETQKKGNIEQILQRKNSLIRPAVANIDQALVIFSVTKPEPNFNLLDRFLITMEQENIPCVLCFNKIDIASNEEKNRIASIYEASGYPILFVSAKTGIGIENLINTLEGKTTTVAGPSGVGKSSLINCLQSEIFMETGSISTKIERGRHTTRHAEFIPLQSGYILDTPGFSSIALEQFETENIWRCFPEFEQYEPACKFGGCAHIHEPGCGVKLALEEGKLSEERYHNYTVFYTECKNKRRF